MVTQALFIVSMVSLVLVTISVLFFPTYPVIILYSLMVALIAIAFYAPIKKRSYGVFFSVVLVILIHGIYFLSLNSALFLAAFMVGAIAMSAALFEPDSNWLLIGMILQVNWIPELVVNLIFGSAFGISLLLILDVVMLCYSALFSIFYLMEHRQSVIWFFAQFVPVLNFFATAWLYYQLWKENKEKPDLQPDSKSKSQPRRKQKASQSA